MARVLFRVVDMARCEPSQQAKTASKTVHVAPNGIIFVLCVTHYLSTSLYLSLPPSHLPLSMMHMLLHVSLHLLSPLLVLYCRQVPCHVTDAAPMSITPICAPTSLGRGAGTLTLT